MAVAAPASRRLGGRARHRLARTWRVLAHSRSSAIGFSVLAAYVAMALLAPLIAPYSPTDIDPAAAFHGPSWSHAFGTDQYGRDVLSRVMYGGRVALVVAFVSTALAVGLGGLLGLAIGYVGGWVDELTTRLIDALLSVPGILVLLVIVAALGTGKAILILGIAVIHGPGVVRVARGAALDVVPREFVAAARARGEGVAAITLREIQPNTRDILLVEFAMRMSWAVLLVSALSFLGFGVNPPTPDWGLMIAENRSTMSLAPWVTIAPAAAVSVLVVGLNLAADGIAKALGVDLTRGSPE